MPGSKIVLPSSDAEDYSRTFLHSIIRRIVNPTSKLLIPYRTRYRLKMFLTTSDATGVGSREIYRSDNCPSWWPEDMVFSPVKGQKAHSLLK